MSGRILIAAVRRHLVPVVALVMASLHPPDVWASQDTVAAAQATDTATLCGQTVGPPATLPPAGADPVIYMLSVCFSAQGNVSLVGVDTYLHYIQMRPSRPSQSSWVAFDDAAVATMRADFKRLWATGFLDDLKIDATDYVFANGVVGKLITYHLEERARARVISYQGSKSLDSGAIEKALTEKGLELRVDAFLDQSTIARVTSTIRDLLEEKGHLGAEVTHVMTPIAGSTKAVNVVFTIDDGPRVSLRDVEFLGNAAFDDDTLGRALKANRPRTLISLFSDRGHYLPTKLEEDATLIEGFYRDRGFIEARVGQPELRTFEDSPDGTTRWAQLRFPVKEGRRFRVGNVTFEGHTLVDVAALQAVLKIKSGDWYSEDRVRSGLNKARELYGAVGHMEFTGYPDLTPRTDEADGPAIVDVVIRMAEGPRYSVNRITFTGNTTTRDNVIRRELRLLEGGVFNTEALKMSVQRLNQLGYFKALEGNETDVTVEKASDAQNAVDVTLKLQEQNRNSIQFGGGVSQYDGLFANVSYTTTNFLGRGESVTVLAQKGDRSSAYQVGLTEPFMFDRPLSGGVDVYSRKVDFLTGIDEVGYSEVRSGVNVTAGYRLFNFGRAFLGYGYEVVQTSVSDNLGDLLDANASAGVPLFTTGLDTGSHTESRVSPSVVYDTVDSPLLPRRGRRLVMSVPVAGGWLGGTVQYLRPEAEVVQYLPVTRRMALGARIKTGLLHPYGRTSALPYYLRYYLGGENELRGYDIRTVGPTDAQNRALGGNKFLLFNVEYYFDLFGPVRALLFHDAGQAFAEGDAIDLRQLRSSSGVELRFLVPVLNVPFRLIHAWNIYRDAFQPARTFRFAIGTTF